MVVGKLEIKEKWKLWKRITPMGPQLCMIYFSAGHGIKNGTNVANPPYVLKRIPMPLGDFSNC